MIIVDNFLSEEHFSIIKNTMISESPFPWYRFDNISSYNEEQTDGCYFGHMFYIEHRPMSDYFDMLLPLLHKIDVKAIHRIKANLYTNPGKYALHDYHVDQIFPHKGAIYYVNTNNGHTILEDGTKIDSVENRMVFFDSTKPHRSTTCSDEKFRVNINFNYF